MKCYTETNEKDKDEEGKLLESVLIQRSNEAAIARAIGEELLLGQQSKPSNTLAVSTDTNPKMGTTIPTRSCIEEEDKDIYNDGNSKEEEEEDAFIMKIVRERQSIPQEDLFTQLQNQPQVPTNHQDLPQNAAASLSKQQPQADPPTPDREQRIRPGAYAAAPGMEPQRATTFYAGQLVVRQQPSAASTEESTTRQSQNEEDSEDEELGNTMTLPRLARESNIERQVQPGAISAGGGPDNNNPPTHASDSSESIISSPSEEGNDGLAVANLVSEENQKDPQELPQARDNNVESEDRQREERMKQFKTKVLLGVIGLLGIILVLVAIVTPSKKQENEDFVPTATPSEPPSNAPSQAPSSYAHSLLSLFPAETVTAILNNEDSPQSKAYRWLLKDIESLPDLSNARSLQRFVLATLYFATSGDNWKKVDNWLNHSVDECDWFHQPAFARKHVLAQLVPEYLRGFMEPPPSSICDDAGLYQHLWLDTNDLGNSLPTELYLLTSLQTLSVGWNQLKGTLSSYVGQLTALKGLVMGDQHLSGTIPTQLGLLSNLNILTLASNKFQASIPSEIWQLTKLDSLILRGMPNLGGSIPSDIGKIPSLRWLITEQSNLSGTLPTEIGLVESLEWILLGVNSYSGTLPTELGLLSGLLHLDTNDNKLEGQLPSELGHLTATTLLKLGNQFLSGTIPTQLVQLTNVQKMELQNGLLDGPIPSEFGQLWSLGRLLLENNTLSGTVPLELSSLQHSLYNLGLEGNPNLSGTIPVGVCNINGTCIDGGPLNVCTGPFGLSFDCTGLLCGCDCPCG
ncbi:Leucine Rich Repeat [Seminavis robusta]|uniref:Leucine Rich Repeat n=1 Tax=Seminavis robusta TaxID=568900 RepID=A0A9N8DXG1_9STRA|nr:Leucine Rich Repeat [Seminavis robusta]|eukprot:Sro449_g145370.1 Leucine Rich Repeat (800) ;mRNA; r:47058-49555